MTAVDIAASRLLQARRDHQPQSAPTLPDVAAAYAVQDQVARALGWFDGQPPRHWKSGGPAREAMTTHAPLPPAGVWASPARSGAWPFTLRGIEAEVALRLGEPVDAWRAAALNAGSARALVDAMCVSIEIVDSRWAEGMQAPTLAKLADLQSHGALVLGAWVPFDEAHDWSVQTGQVHVGAQAVYHFCGSHSMADPAFVLPAWLRHATRDGTVLAAGSVVTTGTWCGLLIAQAGDAVEVVFDGIGAASVLL